MLADLEGSAMISTWEQVLDDAPREKERKWRMFNIATMDIENSRQQ